MKTAPAARRLATAGASTSACAARTLRARAGDVARHVEEILERDRQPIDRRAAYAAFLSRSAVVGFRARGFRVHLHEGAFAFAVGRGDAREHLIDELAARRTSASSSAR